MANTTAKTEEEFRLGVIPRGNLARHKSNCKGKGDAGEHERIRRLRV